jgi:hypothetical protein
MGGSAVVAHQLLNAGGMTAGRNSCGTLNIQRVYCGTPRNPTFIFSLCCNAAGHLREFQNASEAALRPTLPVCWLRKGHHLVPTSRDARPVP